MTTTDADAADEPRRHHLLRSRPRGDRRGDGRPTSASSCSARTSASTAARSASAATCYSRFGGERIRDTPISELGIVGAAVGAAVAGMRPIVEIQFSDFTCQAMDQIVNQAAKIHFMLGGELNVPMVLRAPLGSGTGAAAQHSQSLEAWFAHVPASRSSCRHAGRRQGPAARRDRRPQPGHRPRAQAALPHERPGARRRRAHVPLGSPPCAAPAATSRSSRPA